MEKHDYVKHFFKEYEGTGVKYASELYREYLQVTPKKKCVNLSTFVRWCEYKHERVRVKIARGEWNKISIIYLE